MEGGEEQMEKVVSGEWLVEKTMKLNALTIEAGGRLLPPEGYTLTMTVDGVGTPTEPGHYAGAIVIEVCKDFRVHSVRFGQVTEPNFRMAVCVSDGAYCPECSARSAVTGGEITDTYARDISIHSNEWDFNGIYITGDSDYIIENAHIELDGDGTDDFVGLGAGIAASGNARVTVNHSEIHTRGITRGTAFVGGHSEVMFNHCNMSLISYVPTEAQLEEGTKLDRMMQPPWSMGIRGNGRTTNLAGWGVMRLNHCHVTSNSWGVLSVDGATVNRMYVKDSLIELNGQSGYGSFSICDDLDFDYKAFGDYGCIDRFERSVIRVPTYGVIMSLGNASSEYSDYTRVESGRFGALIFRNSGGYIKVDSGSEFCTEEATFLVKGSNVYLYADHADLKPKNGIILQLMDNDDTGMEGNPFLVPVGETDKKEVGRDLTRADPTEDVFMVISNMKVTGDFYNSTTNLKACCRVDRCVPDLPTGLGNPDFKNVRGLGGDLQGAKNLDLRLEQAHVTGIISCARAAYRPGLEVITQENCEELGEITCTAAPAINNGVILTLKGGAVWTVTGTSYLTVLMIEQGAVIQGKNGMDVVLTLDGRVVEVKPGRYEGEICIALKR